MSDADPPTVFVSYSHDSEHHREQVLAFATFLRARIGLDVHLDQWDDNRRRDWSAWAGDLLRKADFVLAIASPQYRRRADGEAPPHEGRGAQYEGASLRDQLTRDLRGQTERILPVVLPGGSVEDIPHFLNPHSTTRFHVDRFTEEGVRGLVAAITGVGEHPLPARGEWLQGGVRPAGATRVRLATGLTRLDHSPEVRAGRARIDGTEYGDSIVLRPGRAVAGGSFVEVDLGGAYSRLTAVVGVLDDAAEPFQVGHFLVRVDGTRRLDVKVALGKPAAVDVDLAGALRLRLEMDRPGRHTSPLAGARSSHPPELAWGDPTLF